MSIVVPAMEFRQRGVRMYVAIVPVSELDKFSVDVWDPQKAGRNKGYQRRPEERRVRHIADFIADDDAIMPVAGLVNIREKGKVKFSRGLLAIPDGVQVWVVDMQHRLKGLVLAEEEGKLSGGFNFPLVITEGLDMLHEAVQFYIINTSAKKMDIALTRRLLISNRMIRTIINEDPNRAWEIKGVQIAIQLGSVETKNPWYGQLKAPNADPRVRTVATEKSFVTSLKKLIQARPHTSAGRFATRLASFWTAIRDTVPEAFKEPRKNLIQKTLGMNALNYYIVPIFFSRYKNAEFRKHLRGLAKLPKNFWRQRNKKGAKRFGSGQSGQGNLALYIAGQLGLKI